MPVLDCSVLNCTFNESNYCCRSEIGVQGQKANANDETCCGSFQNSEGRVSNSSMNPNYDLNIKCEATTCSFNEEERCSADHIKISGSGASTHEDTLCSSFTTK